MIDKSAEKKLVIEVFGGLAGSIFIISVLICCFYGIVKVMKRRISKRIYQAKVSYKAISINSGTRNTYRYIPEVSCSDITAFLVKAAKNFFGIPKKFKVLHFIISVLLPGSTYAVIHAWKAHNPFYLFQYSTIEQLGFPDNILDVDQMVHRFSSWSHIGTMLSYFCFGLG